MLHSDLLPSSAQLFPGPEFSWQKDPPGGVSFTQHKLSFQDILILASNRLSAEANSLEEPTLLVCGYAFSNIVESLPGFWSAWNKGKKANFPDGSLHHSLTAQDYEDKTPEFQRILSQYRGMLNGRWRVFFDPKLPTGATLLATSSYYSVIQLTEDRHPSVGPPHP